MVGVQKAGAFLGVGEAVIFTLDVPILQEVRDIVPIELQGSELTRARHYGMRT